MFIGHFAVAFGAKKYAPQVSLGVLFLAAQLADLVWPSLVLLGFESFEIDPGNTVLTPLNFVHYPYSHSLLALAVWSLALAGLYALLARVDRRALLLIVALVLSHWVLDVLTHRPDLPLTLADSTHVGLGLWNIPVVAVPVELLLFGFGVWLYARHTRARNRQGSIGFWVLATFLLLTHAANVLGPPPPSVAAVAWSAQAMWLIVLWGFWIDRNRVSRPGRRAGSVPAMQR